LIRHPYSGIQLTKLYILIQLIITQHNRHVIQSEISVEYDECYILEDTAITSISKSSISIDT